MVQLVNDDGPPSDVSPYFLPFTTALQASGHQVKVVIPDKPLSWVGKAHAFGKRLTATRVCPLQYSSGQSCEPGSEDECRQHGWYILDGSPASCTQIGLFHLDWAASEIDLVISGPNHGRNASSIYNLSSGTVGGALEGALCGKPAISVSFGSKDPQPSDIIEAACTRTIKLVEWLCEHWDPAVEVYNLNVPMLPAVSQCSIVFTKPCQNYWSKGSLFVNEKPQAGECNGVESNGTSKDWQQSFKWHPELSDIKKAAMRSAEGEDLWASENGCIS
jgi:5'/3'-nucleotidase SurE